MSGEINRVPRGLLSMLDMKARGNSPRDLSGSVIGVLELRDLYGLDRRRTIQGTQVINAATQFNVFSMQVPQEEIWLVESITIGTQAVILGGAELAYTPGWVHADPPGLRFTALAAPSLIVPFIPGDNPVVSWEGHMWAKGGSNPAIWCTRFSGAWAPDPTMIIEVLYTPFEV